MPMKKKTGRRPAAKTRAKTKPKAKTKLKAKAKAKPKAKAKAKPKAKPKKAKVTAKPRVKAKAKPKAKVTAKPRVTAKPKVTAKSNVTATGPLVLDEVLEEPLLDASTILRIKDGVARSQRDVDEDELQQFPDPSLVVEVVTMEPRPDSEATDESDLPGLFGEEARRQRERAADERSSGQSQRRNGTLFGTPPDDRDDD